MILTQKYFLLSTLSLLLPIQYWYWNSYIMFPKVPVTVLLWRVSNNCVHFCIIRRYWICWALRTCSSMCHSSLMQHIWIQWNAWFWIGCMQSPIFNCNRICGTCYGMHEEACLVICKMGFVMDEYVWNVCFLFCKEHLVIALVYSCCILLWCGI